MQLQQLGPVLQKRGAGVATLGLTPLFDRAAMVRRIALQLPSAADTWTVSVGGREIMRFRDRAAGNQVLLRSPVPQVGTTAPTPSPVPNFFDFCRQALNQDPSIPVPQGQTLTIASVGGATANIIIEYIEVDVADAAVSALLNHYTGGNFLMPLWGLLAASSAVVGVNNYDTQISPIWVPSIFTGVSLAAGWEVDVLAIFLEGGGVNTFSGAADHQSKTVDHRLIRNGVTLFSREATGLTCDGAASAAGSANTVIGAVDCLYPPFLEVPYEPVSVLPNPLAVRQGDNVQGQVNTSGDQTGSASLAPFMFCAIASVRRLQGVG